MAVTTRLLLLPTLHTLSVAAWNNPVGTTRGTKWLEQGRSVLVHVGTPGLPLWNQEQIGEDIPSALILNFTVSADNKTHLLQPTVHAAVAPAYAPTTLRASNISDIERIRIQKTP
jgi:hypothetical protein